MSKNDLDLYWKNIIYAVIYLTVFSKVYTNIFYKFNELSPYERLESKSELAINYV